MGIRIVESRNDRPWDWGSISIKHLVLDIWSFSVEWQHGKILIILTICTEGKTNSDILRIVNKGYQEYCLFGSSWYLSDIHFLEESLLGEVS